MTAEYAPMPHKCPFDTATDVAEKLVKDAGEFHRKPPISQAICHIRRSAIRYALEKQGCDGPVNDRDSWAVCPNMGIANAGIGMAIGPNENHIDLAEYGANLSLFGQSPNGRIEPTANGLYL